MNKTGGLRVLPIGSGVVPPKRAPSSSSVRYTILAAYLCADSPASDAMKIPPVESKGGSVAKRLGPEMEFGPTSVHHTPASLSTSPQFISYCVLRSVGDARAMNDFNRGVAVQGSVLLGESARLRCVVSRQFVITCFPDIRSGADWSNRQIAPRPTVTQPSHTPTSVTFIPHPHSQPR